jgi:hypothetical protein
MLVSSIVIEIKILLTDQILDHFVRHSVHKGDGSRLCICVCYSWEMALNVDVDAPFGNMQTEESRGVIYRKAYVTGDEIPAEFSLCSGRVGQSPYLSPIISVLIIVQYIMAFVVTAK